MPGARPGSRPGSGSRRDWGWHALSDDWARRIVAGASVQRGDLVLDIGAGTGALTAPLLATGARVIAVELHAGRATGLRARWPVEIADGRLVVVRTDARDLRLPRRPFRVVSNPPYAACSPILQRLLAPGSRLRSAYLVVPRTVAERFVRGDAPGAGRWLRDYDLSIERSVPRNAFRPPPRVATVVLVIRR